MSQTLPQPQQDHRPLFIFLIKVNENGFCLEKSVILSVGCLKSLQNEGWEPLLAENAGDSPSWEGSSVWQKRRLA